MKTNRAVPDAVRLLARAEAQRDSLREELALTKALLDQRDRPTFDGRCLYCGVRCYGRVCRVHQPVLQLDPYFRMEQPA